MSPPAIVEFVIGPVVLIVEFKEAPIRTVRRNICSFLIILRCLIQPLPIQPFIKGTAVIKHTVQNNFHTPAVNLFHKSGKKSIAGLQILFVHHPLNIFAGMEIIIVSLRKTFSAVLHNHAIVRIYIVVILNIIFMIGRRYKDWIQIQNIHTQLLQIIQLIPYSLNISSIKCAHIHTIRTFIPIRHLMYAFVNINIFPVFHIIGCIPVAEPICKDLVHNSAFCPIRRFKARHNPERIVFLQILRHAQTVIKASLVACTDFKIITDRAVQRRNCISIIVKSSLCICFFHTDLVASADKKHIIHIIYRCPELNSYLLSQLRLKRCLIICAFIAEKRRFI